VYYVDNTRCEAEEHNMDLSKIQPRDWMIAVVAFIAGALIF
jgi:hypothetical protein